MRTRALIRKNTSPLAYVASVSVVAFNVFGRAIIAGADPDRFPPVPFYVKRSDFEKWIIKI